MLAAVSRFALQQDTAWRVGVFAIHDASVARNNDYS